MKPRNGTGRRAQAAVEYLLALCALLVVVTVTMHIIYAARSASVRTVALVSSDYP